MKGREELTDSRVRKSVLMSIELIEEAQSHLHLPISPNLRKTRERLKRGVFRADIIKGATKEKYATDYGMFIPPSTIILDKRLPIIDKPMNIPELTKTLIVYSAVHEVIHADDHTGGDRLLLATREHILDAHKDKLKKSMKIIRQDGNYDCISDQNDLACLWAIQYADMVTHYRAYVVLRHMNYSKIDHIWSRFRIGYFPPNLFTCIEAQKGIRYVFTLFNEKLGEYCLIEALKEYEAIKERDASRPIV